LALAIGLLVPALLAVYVAVRVSARYVIRFRARDGRKTKLMFRITSAKLRAEFDNRLRENRDAAARYADPDGAAQVPDPIANPRPPAWPRVALLAAVFAVTAGALTAGGVALYGVLAELPGGWPFGPAGGGGDSLAGPGLGPKPPTVPDITPETIATGLVGHKFAFQSGPGKPAQLWTVEPGEVREVIIERSEPDAGGQIRRLDVRVTLEGGRQRLRGVLSLLYMRSGGGWALMVVTPKDTGGKGQPLELTNLK
jgi:hypothetical protein